MPGGASNAARLLVGLHQAAWKPRKKGARSIWEIVQHVTYWEDCVVQRLDGVTAKFSDEESWLSPEEISEEAWAKTVARLKNRHNALMKRLRTQRKFDFDEPFPGEKLPTGEMLYGVLAHDCYHTGRILTLHQLQGIGL